MPRMVHGFVRCRPGAPRAGWRLAAAVLLLHAPLSMAAAPTPSPSPSPVNPWTGNGSANPWTGASPAVATPTPQRPASSPTPEKPRSAERGQRVSVTPTATPTPFRWTYTPTPTPTPIPTATPTPVLPLDTLLPGGMTVQQYLESQVPGADQAAQEPTSTPEPEAQAASDDAGNGEPRAASIALGTARVAPAVELTGLWKVVRYRDLIERIAQQIGVDWAMLAAFMEIEGSGEQSVSHAGALGLMQLLPDKFAPGDDPFDPETNVLRAAQYIRELQRRWHIPELVAAAYFGALDDSGRITDASDGILTGPQYVERFQAAYRRYKESQTELPRWLVSPFGTIPLTSDMIRFGFLDDYGPALAHEIRGPLGVARYGTLHLGLDLQLPGRPDGGRGTPVVAPIDGRVIRTADPAGGPYGVWIESEKLNLRARLMHLDALVDGIATGVEVKAGQQIGILGAQGTEGFPHLHLAFERLSDGERINPARLYRIFDRSDPATLSASWYEEVPAGPPSAGGIDARLIPDGDTLGGWRVMRAHVTRWGPFPAATP